MGLRGALRSGDGARNFPRHAGGGGNGARKIHVGRERRPHPLTPPLPIAIPIPVYQKKKRSESHPKTRLFSHIQHAKTFM